MENDSPYYSATQIATEFAFNKLIETAKKHRIPLKPVMGLMYLPSQEVTRQFQLACRDIIDLLLTDSQENAQKTEAEAEN